MKPTDAAVWKWVQLDDLLIICASSGNLVDEDFDPCLELHRTNQVTRAVAWMLGNASMNAAQRKKAGEAMGDHPTANISDSMMVRGVVTAMSWMGKPWRSFASSEMDAAIAFVGLPSGRTVAEVVSALQSLKRTVDEELRARNVA